MAVTLPSIFSVQLTHTALKNGRFSGHILCYVRLHFGALRHCRTCCHLSGRRSSQCPIRCVQAGRSVPGWARSLCRVEESVNLLAARTRPHEPSRCQSILPVMLLDARSSPAARARRNRSAQWHQRTSAQTLSATTRWRHMSMSRRTSSVARRWHAARSQYRPLRQLPCSAAAAAAADSSCSTLQLQRHGRTSSVEKAPRCE